MAVSMATGCAAKRIRRKRALSHAALAQKVAQLLGGHARIRNRNVEIHAPVA